MELELEKIKRIAAGVLGLRAEEIPDHASFADELFADSLELFQIVLEIEEAFQVAFPPDLAARMVSAADAAEALRSLAAFPDEEREL